MSQHADLRELLRIVAAHGIAWVQTQLQAQGVNLLGPFWGVYLGDEYNRQLVSLYLSEEEARLECEVLQYDEVQSVPLDVLPEHIRRGERPFVMRVNLHTGQKISAKPDRHVPMTPTVQVWPGNPTELLWSGWALPEQLEERVEAARLQYLEENPKPEEVNRRLSHANKLFEAQRQRLQEGQRRALEQACRDLEADGRPMAKQAAAELKARGVVTLGTARRLAAELQARGAVSVATSNALAAERANDAPSGLLVAEKRFHPESTRCTHGRLRPGRLCVPCQVVGRQPDRVRERVAWLEYTEEVGPNWLLRWVDNGMVFHLDTMKPFSSISDKIVNFEDLLKHFGLEFDSTRVVELMDPLPCSFKGENDDRVVASELQAVVSNDGAPSDGSPNREHGPETGSEHRVATVAGPTDGKVQRCSLASVGEESISAPAEENRGGDGSG